MHPALAGKFVADQAHHVTKSQQGIVNLSNQILRSILDKKFAFPDSEVTTHPLKGHPRAVDMLFVTDTLNFCFWSYPHSQKWTVDGKTGYYALEAALYRALKDGFDITNPKYYSQISKEDFTHIMRSDNETQISLIEERIAALHEVGNILLQKYNSTFESCVKEANKSAVKLLQIVIENFPCFKDEAVYKNQNVSFYKRAQILIAHLWYFFNKTSWGDFHDIDQLTMFADYRVPQVLVYFGVLNYSPQLMEKLKNDVLLPPGSEEEVEIRGCSIHAIELLKKELEAEIKKRGLHNVEVPNSCDIDNFLWFYRRKHAKELETVPFHKTIGIYY